MTDSAGTVQSWVDRYPPRSARPYLKLARVEKPIGTWLLLWPCWWGLALAAAGTWPDPWLLALFGVGALVMRGAGCVVNDIADRDFDARVARTATRPLASGDLSVLRALVFLATLLAVGLLILVQMNAAAISPSMRMSTACVDAGPVSPPPTISREVSVLRSTLTS